MKTLVMRTSQRSCEPLPLTALTVESQLSCTLDQSNGDEAEVCIYEKHRSIDMCSWLPGQSTLSETLHSCSFHVLACVELTAFRIYLGDFDLAMSFLPSPCDLPVTRNSDSSVYRLLHLLQYPLLAHTLIDEHSGNLQLPASPFDLNLFYKLRLIPPDSQHQRRVVSLRWPFSVSQTSLQTSV